MNQRGPAPHHRDPLARGGQDRGPRRGSEPDGLRPALRLASRSRARLRSSGRSSSRSLTRSRRLVTLHRAYPPRVRLAERARPRSSPTHPTEGRSASPSSRERFEVSPATIRRDLGAARGTAASRSHPRRCGAHGVVYELPASIQGRAPRGGETQDRRRPRRPGSPTAWRSVSPAARRRTEVARALVEHDRLTVVTNALNIAARARDPSQPEAGRDGRTARPESYELVGPLAEQTLEGLQLDVAFVGVDGIDPVARLYHAPRGRGPHERDVDRARASGHRGRRRSKVGGAAFARICPLGRIEGSSPIMPRTPWRSEPSATRVCTW